MTLYSESQAWAEAGFLIFYFLYGLQSDDMKNYLVHEHGIRQV